MIVFDELVNYDGFDGDTGELKAWYEFITENKVDYEWIGMNGTQACGDTNTKTSRSSCTRLPKPS